MENKHIHEYIYFIYEWTTNVITKLKLRLEHLASTENITTTVCVTCTLVLTKAEQVFSEFLGTHCSDELCVCYFIWVIWIASCQCCNIGYFCVSFPSDHDISLVGALITSSTSRWDYLITNYGREYGRSHINILIGTLTWFNSSYSEEVYCWYYWSICYFGNSGY